MSSTVPEDEVEEVQQLINSQPARDHGKNRSYNNIGKPFQSDANSYKRYFLKKKEFIQNIQDHVVCSTLLELHPLRQNKKTVPSSNTELHHPIHS